MKSTVEPVEGNKVKVCVEVDQGEFEKAVNEAFRKIAREVRIPGFRPGKAPRRVLEAHLGKDVARGQALQDAIPDYYIAAVREHDVDVIAAPEIDITDGESEGDVVFEATVQVRPEITLGGYESLRVTVESPEPSDEDIDAQLERLRNAHATHELVERPASEGDQVVIDIAGELDGEPAPGLTAEDYSYEVGSGGIVAEVDEQLTGAKAGDILEFSAAHPVQEDAELEFRILVKEVRAKVLPELDDEFAVEASEFDTLAELRDDLVQRATAVRRAQVAASVREQTGQALADLVTDELPEPLVEAEMQERIQDMSMRLQAQGMNLEMWLQMQGKDPESFVAELRETALTAAKVDLALRALAEAEGIEVTDDDLGTEWAAVAERVESTPEEVRDQFERAEQVSAVRSDIKKRKAFDWLLEQVEIVDEEGNPVDREALEAPAEPPAQPGSDTPAAGDAAATDPDESEGPEDLEADAAEESEEEGTP